MLRLVTDGRNLAIVDLRTGEELPDVERAVLEYDAQAGTRLTITQRIDLQPGPVDLVGEDEEEPAPKSPPTL